MATAPALKDSIGQEGGHSAGMTTLTYISKSTVWTTPTGPGEERKTRIVGGGVVVLDQPVQTAACATGGLATMGSQTVAARRAVATTWRITSTARSSRSHRRPRWLCRDSEIHR